MVHCAGVAHERYSETLIKACHASKKQGLLDSVKDHAFHVHLLASVDVITLQVLARPRCRRLAARPLALSEDKVVGGSWQ